MPRAGQRRSCESAQLSRKIEKIIASWGSFTLFSCGAQLNCRYFVNLL